MLLIIVALLINVAVLISVTFGLLGGSAQMDAAFGPATPARGILLSVYLAILLLSLAGLAGVIWSGAQALPWIATLIALQVVYKVITAIVVGPSNPVVQANLAIALFHSIALWAALTR